MGDAISQVVLAQTIEAMRDTPIHTYLQRIIPYLEQRQQCAKYSGSRKSDESYLEFIKQINEKIIEILDIPKQQ